MSSVDPYSSPLAFFAAEVKRLREKAGMTQAELAKATAYSVDAVKSIETARRIPKIEFAGRADEALGTDEQLTRLQRLVEETSMLPWFRDLVEVERVSTVVREYDPYLIPALLQVEDYTRALASARRPALSPDDIERAVVLRMSRQEILDQDDPRHLWFIIDESVLHRIVGSAEIMRKQCAHIAQICKQPDITLQVIPNSEGAACAYGRTFTILTPKSGSQVVYLEDIGSARYVRQRDEIRRYAVAFDHLRASALGEERSVKLIKGE